MPLVIDSKCARHAACCLLVTVFAVPPALAQSAALPALHPADAQVSVPPPVYSSAFEGYQAFGTEKLGNWRDLNDTVGVLGGHNAHLRDVAKKVEMHGTLLETDRAARRLRVEHDAIRELGWPALTAFWQIEEHALQALTANTGARLRFTLEKAPSGEVYIITGVAPSDRPAPAASVKPAGESQGTHGGHKQ